MLASSTRCAAPPTGNLSAWITPRQLDIIKEAARQVTHELYHPDYGLLYYDPMECPDPPCYYTSIYLKGWAAWVVEQASGLKAKDKGSAAAVTQVRA